jgi:thiamine pyrophosphokinase
LPERSTIIVVSAGPAGAAAVRDMSFHASLPAGARVVAADGGVDTALALGLDVTAAIGDFDSVTDAGLAEVEAAGAWIERHPRDKDATDLELALDAAVELGAERIVVVGDPGGRVDHLLAGLLLLAAGKYAGLEIDAYLGRATVHVLRVERALAGEPGELISLLALGGAAVGVVTAGLLYPLRGETLEPGSSRGISNVFAEHEARISVGGGVLAVVRPGELERSAS